MIEIYLFVNPLGGICLDIEQNILKLVETNNKNIQFRIIPLLNIKTVDRMIKLQNTKTNSIVRRNQLFENIYSAALDFKAAQLQGKKKGRKLLLALQQAVAVEEIPYSSELAEKLALDAGCDLEMFKTDRRSDFVKELFQTDQQVAHEMGVSKHPSAVIYNYEFEDDYGILVDDCETISYISYLCQAPNENKYTFQQSLPDKYFNDNRVSRKHLHLL